MTSQLDSAGEAKLAEAEREMQLLDDAYRELAADAALMGASMLPPPWGTVADVASVGKSLWAGDWGGALLDVIGVVPVFGDAAKAAGKGAKALDRLKDLERALQTAKAALARQKTAAIFGRKSAAAKYWEQIRTEGRAAYDKAIKNCSTTACADDLANLKGSQYRYTPRTGENGAWVGERGDGAFVATPGSRLDTALDEFNKANGTSYDRITYKDGFPDYANFLYRGPGGVPGKVEILQKGGKADFAPADEAYGALIGDPDWVRPPGYTWHHVPDGTTMELVPTTIHGFPESGHAGGTSLMKQPEY